MPFTLAAKSCSLAQVLLTGIQLHPIQMLLVVFSKAVALFRSFKLFALQTASKNILWTILFFYVHFQSRDRLLDATDYVVLITILSTFFPAWLTLFNLTLFSLILSISLISWCYILGFFLDCFHFFFCWFISSRVFFVAVGSVFISSWPFVHAGQMASRYWYSEFTHLTLHSDCW